MTAQTNRPNTIDSFLTMSTQALQAANISTARLDSELLLSSRLGLSREWLLAHGDAEIAESQWNELCQLLYLRSQHCPLAYLTGYKEFYGRNFQVNHHVLIPRPESEQIIEQLNLLLQADDSTKTVIDVGTGSGCLAITIKLEHPELTVWATDISQPALSVARNNAKNFGLDPDSDLHLAKSDLLSNLPSQQQFDVIVANLPYVNRHWSWLSPELAYEPDLALYDDSDSDSLGLIKQLIIQSTHHLRPHGHLILEMDQQQVSTIIDFAQQHHFRLVSRLPYTITLQRKD